MRHMLRSGNSKPRCLDGRRGFTLVELVMVLAILVILAGLVIPKLDSVSENAQDTVARTNIRIVAAAIASSAPATGCWNDTHFIPIQLETLFKTTLPVNAELFNSNLAVGAPPDVIAFDPVTQLGWKAPYIVTSTTTYPDPAATKAGSTQSWSARGFTSRYGTPPSGGNPGGAALADPWGNPYVLQIPTLNLSDSRINTFEKCRMRSRLVSAGADGKIDTDPDVAYPPVSGRGDDLVLFLFQADIDQ